MLDRALHVVDDWWVAAAGIAFIIGSDYKFRTRPPGLAQGGGIDSSVMFELALYALVGGYLFLARFRIPRARRVPLPLYLLGCFVAFSVLSVAWTPYPQYALVRCLEACILFAVVVVACMDGTRAHFHRFAHAYLVLIALSIAYGFVVPSTPINNIQVGRFTWLAIHPTVSGAMMGLACVVATGYVISGRKERPGPHWPPALYVVVLLVVAGGGIAAQTRGALLGGVAGSFVVILSSRRGRAFIETALICIVLVAGVAIVGSSKIETYFQRGEDASELTTLNNRTELWDLAAEAIRKHPVFGNGITSSRGIFFSEIGLGGGHNAAINVLVELGFLGFGIWVAIVVSLVLGVRRLTRAGPRSVALDRSLLLGVITFLVVDGIFFEGAGALANVASTWFFLSVGWYVVARKASERGAAVQADAVRPAVDA